MPLRQMGSRLWGVGLLAVAATAAGGLLAGAAEPAGPNVVLIFADDLGYADIGPFGAQGYPTPNLDRMAREGRRFTHFYAAQAVCSASRAALMTGCYSNRVGILGALGPGAKTGIGDGELTLGELFRQKGYATAAYGKWHLGDAPRFLPVRHGFDEYFGLPYSNDMWPYHPDGPSRFPARPLIENDRVVNANVTAEDQPHLTTWYTERAVKFIESHREGPFFVYLAHSMPHVPLFVSEKYAGKTPRGLFGDVIAEIDWSVGQVLDALARTGLDEKTLVLFTSDNGPWLSYGNHAGSARPLREGKGTAFEGGVREPCVMRWPGHVPAGTTCSELAATIDILPTMARLIGADLPADRPIDGRDIGPLLTGQAGAKTPHDAFYYYWDRELQAVRSGPWKLHFPHAYRTLAGAPGHDGKPGPYRQGRIGLALFNLEDDPGETTNVAPEHPDVVAHLESLAEQARADLGDSLTHRTGAGVREPGKL